MKNRNEKKLNKLLKKKNIDLSNEELENKFNFKDRINELNETINKIESNEDDINYF